MFHILSLQNCSKSEFYLILRHQKLQICLILCLQKLKNLNSSNFKVSFDFKSVHDLNSGRFWEMKIFVNTWSFILNLAAALKWFIFDPMLVMLKCVWHIYHSFLHFSAVCFQYFKHILAFPTWGQKVSFQSQYSTVFN